MKKKKIIWLFGLLLFFICISTATLAVQQYKPLIADPLMEPWRWHLLPELSGKGIRCMIESQDGSIWFGTGKGVIHYDGLHWITYTLGDSLLGESVLGMLASKDGRIYAVSRQGINCFEDGRWIQIFSYSVPYERLWRISSIIEASDGSIWAGLPNGALRIQDSKFIFYTTKALSDSVKKFAPNVEIAIVPEKVAKHIQKFDIYNIFEDRERNIWCGFYYGTILQYKNSGNWRIVHKSDEKPYINQTRDGRIWVISDAYNIPEISGPRFYNSTVDTGWQYVDLESIGGDHNNCSFLQTSDGLIWIGGFENFYIFKDGKWNIYNSSNLHIPLPSRIYLNESSDGALWIYGYQNDVYRIEYNNSRWVRYLGVNFQFEKEDGSKWFISADNGVVCEYNGEWIRYGIEDGLMDAPSTLLCTRTGQIWAAGSHKNNTATAYFDGKRWRIKVHYLVSWGIDYRAAFEDLNGYLYFSSTIDAMYDRGDIGGVLKYDPFEKDTTKAWKFIDPSLVGHAALYGIGQTADSTIWLGRSSLVKFDGNRYKEISDPKVLKDAYIECIENSENGHLWVGTRSYGVFYYNGDIWKNYNVEKNGLTSNTIVSLIPDSDTTAWVATDKDICYFDGNIWLTKLFPEQMTMEREGGTLKISRRGTLWINRSSRSWYRRSRPGNSVTQEILSKYWAVAYQPDTDAPETKITMYEKKVSRPGNAIFSWKGTDTWKVTSDKELQYSYRLDRGKWSPYIAERNHIFLSLPSGNHVFEVRARDKSLNTDPTPAKVRFNVLPALWQTWWFKTLIFFAVLCLFVTFYKIWTNSVQERNKQLEEINVKLNEQIVERKRAEDRMKDSLKEKEVLLREIHHRVKNNLQVISSLLNLQARNVNDKQALNMFRESQDRVRSMALIHAKLYQSPDLASIDFSEYIKSLVKSLYVSYGIDSKKIGLNIKIEDVSLGIDLAVPCGLIVNELVSNALKHAFPHSWERKGAIEISLSNINENEVELIVRDNGVGLPKDFDLYKTKSLGLHLVTILVEDQLQGQIKLYRRRGVKFQIRFKELEK